jgi:UDP-N-acetylmuramoylalanine--D-glutamate ligase
MEFAVADSRNAPPRLAELEREFPQAVVHLGPFRSDQFRRAGRLVVSPGVSLGEPAVQAARSAGVEVLGDIELFAREAQAPVVAITGSNGKSTVTALLGEMFARTERSALLGGNLGRPALDLLTETTPEYYVLELSSFQLECTSSLCPAVATVLNVSPDHMDRYASLAEYTAAKQRIYRGAQVCIVNADDPHTQLLDNTSSGVQGSRSSIIRFTLARPQPGEFGVWARDDGPWLAQGEQALLAATDLRLAGGHNLANALAGLALGTAVDLPLPAMLEALRTFSGLPHRMQRVAEHQGVVWYDDSKGTNVGATLAAIRGMPTKFVLIAGGLGKEADFSSLHHALQGRARAVVLLGQDAHRIERVISGLIPVYHVSDMDAAVSRARSLVRPGDSVLLSPACASFDMFDNYAARGRAFAEALGRVVL